MYEHKRLHYLDADLFKPVQTVLAREPPRRLIFERIGC